MRTSDIRIGDRLTLKRDNPYGFGPLTPTVSDLTMTVGTVTTWTVRIHPNGAPHDHFKTFGADRERAARFAAWYAHRGPGYRAELLPKVRHA